MNFLVKQNDKALREALRQQSEQHMRLPSNFAYTTMRRIERERQTEEKREKLAAVITIASCCLLGVGTMAYFYGEALLGGLSSMLQQHEGFDVLPGLTFCCLFFALFNTYLRKKFAS